MLSEAGGAERCKACEGESATLRLILQGGFLETICRSARRLRGDVAASEALTPFGLLGQMFLLGCCLVALHVRGWSDGVAAFALSLLWSHTFGRAFGAILGSQVPASTSVASPENRRSSRRHVLRWCA